MRFIACAAIAFAALLFPSSALGQEQGSVLPSSEIVVTGTREREDQVRDFVKSLTPARGGSIPRFIDALCPLATGLVPAQNEAVAARLREVAAGAGIPVAKRGCVPNALVIVTPNKRDFIELLAERRPDFFGMMSPRAIRRLARAPGPAAAWQLEGPVNSSGVPLRWDDALGAYVNPTTEPASRLTILGRQAFDAAALVVETAALDGLTPIQLADYAAMRLLAKFDPARLPAGTSSTILTVLTAPMGSPVPITMTRWDLGLLRGLYGSSLNLPPSSQRSQIVGAVSRELDAADPKRD